MCVGGGGCVLVRGEGALDAYVVVVHAREGLGGGGGGVRSVSKGVLW